MIENKIKDIVLQELKKLNYNCENFNVEKTKISKFGDFSCNIALILCKQLNKDCMQLANEIASSINNPIFDKIEVSKPGFINFFLNFKVYNELIKQIIDQNEKYPVFEKTGLNYNLEFVSANPTGLLHIGHARNAVFGSVLNNLLQKVGINVLTEYLINDAGNQMNKLAYSTLVRYKQLFNVNIELCDDSYHGEEIILVAQALKDKYNDKFLNAEITDDFYIKDKAINDEIRTFAGNYLLDLIKQDLKSIGVEIQLYFSENNDHHPNAFKDILVDLKDYIYEKDNAIWLKTTLNGDDKDRVLIKSDKSHTYFLPDIVYHKLKATRSKIDKLINIWGADHHSYIIRVESALKFLGFNNIMDVICMQMVRLIKDNKEFKLSKRSGNSLTLRDLVNTIGIDACRWFLVSTSVNSHIEIDIDVALSKDNKNPIYYVQYAYARGKTLLKKSNVDFNNIKEFNLLTLEIERNILNQLLIFKSTLKYAALNYEPSKLTNYLLQLAKLFHNYYSNVQILDENNIDLQNQRLCLIYICTIVIKNSLILLGINVLERM